MELWVSTTRATSYWLARISRDLNLPKGTTMRLQQHIGIFEKALSEDYCKILMTHFNSMSRQGMTFDRRGEAPPNEKADEGFDWVENPMNFANSYPLLQPALEVLNRHYQVYRDAYIGLHTVEGISVMGAKMQRTRPGQGYHVWHFESGSYEASRRLVVFSFTIQKPEAGGETEFLDQNLRIAGEVGELLIWPASYTHVHRGNPPLAGDKVILTGWIGFR